MLRKSAIEAEGYQISSPLCQIATSASGFVEEGWATRNAPYFRARLQRYAQALIQPHRLRFLSLYIGPHTEL
jgi:hypothetical protein